MNGSCTCGCCNGIEAITPVSTANRPGLPSLHYRVGTHGSFLETMKARLTLAGHPELKRLTARDGDDPAIALLDAWATVADVLTFYQERIANEGYLRTATERRSVLELARLVGYRLRPGVASTVYLAYTLDKGSPVTIPAGARVQRGLDVAEHPGRGHVDDAGQHRHLTRHVTQHGVQHGTAVPVRQGFRAATGPAGRRSFSGNRRAAARGG